jgi:phosphoenolpyruvate carboxylase
MSYDSPTALLYHTYNSLFLSLPFNDIADTGKHLALFATHCGDGFEKGINPIDIIESFWQKYYETTPHAERLNLLFYFIQYVERQVVLFDSVEDALFEHNNEMQGRGSLKHLLNRLDSDVLQEKLVKKIKNYSVRMVLTAHPTQFYPGKVLGIINDLGDEIKSHDLEKVRLLLMQLGKTAFYNRQRPTPLDEASSLGWYLENVFYDTIPDILFRLLRATNQDVTTFENPQLLELGFWPGGDRDGNPNVTSEITCETARRMRESILRCYHREVRQLRRRLTFRGTEDYIIKVERTLNNTLYYPQKEIYHNCSELLAHLLTAREILIENHDSLFLDDLDHFILKVRVFGFFFAALDIRQDSRRHTYVWDNIFQNWSEKFPWFNIDDFHNTDENTQINRLLTTNYRLDENDFSDAFVKETIRSFNAIAEIQRDNGELGCHRYIISNCGSALDVAKVLALAQLTLQSNNPGAPVPVDVIPLFETIEDLAECGQVMRTLYTNPHYAKHLAARNKVQTIMLGFSDGTKDGGYLRANWSIYRAKAQLTSIAREHGISVIFFDGRGGPPGRGGGNNASYYAAHGADIEDMAIQVTIQGQTVSSTYGTRPSAQFNIERLLTAGLENPLFHTHTHELPEADMQIMDELANAAYEAYLLLKNHPNFVPYLEKRTPLPWYGDTNIASRPTKRNGDEGMKFEDLRAIPFVGAWAQMKQNIPGYHGFGAALASFKGRRLTGLSRLYRDSLFFRTLVENSMQALSKTNFEATKYLAKDPQFGPFWEMMRSEYELTYQKLLELSGQKELLQDNPRSRYSIALREDIVLPIIAIQQYALQQLSQPDVPAADQEVYRRLVLRAMFGIINAARNAA